MKKKLLVILAIVFAQNAFADKVSFYCRSEMMPSYKGYSKSYIQSVGCMDLQRGPFGKSARETAERHCQLWANGLELTKYTTKIFSEQDDNDLTYFIDYLSQGLTKSEALQKAKMDFLVTANPKTANPIYRHLVSLISLAPIRQF